MSLVTPVELVGVCRVNYNVNLNAVSYLFSNGFQTGTPVGAINAVGPIVVNGAGDYTLFLSEQLYPGSSTLQGGVFAEVTSCETTGTPVAVFGTVEIEPPLAGDYAACDPKTAVRIRLYNPAGVLTAASFMLAIYRNPITLY